MTTPAKTSPEAPATVTPRDMALVFASLSLALPLPAQLTGRTPQESQDLRHAAHRLYAKVLAGHTFEAIEEAVSKHLGDPVEGKFWPSPAHILSRLADVPKPAHPAEAAWTRLLKRVRAGGKLVENHDGTWRYAHDARDLLDPRELAALADIGGYPAVATCDPAWIDRKRRDFLAAYDRAPSTALTVA